MSAAESEESTCPVCGKTFTLRVSCPWQKYCSGVCKRQARRERYGAEHVVAWKRIPRICVECGKEFFPVFHNQITCSQVCRQKHNYERNREYDRKRSAGRGGEL